MDTRATYKCEDVTTQGFSFTRPGAGDQTIYQSIYGAWIGLWG
jgi:hypothetical protein